MGLKPMKSKSEKAPLKDISKESIDRLIETVQGSLYSQNAEYSGFSILSKNDPEHNEILDHIKGKKNSWKDLKESRGLASLIASVLGDALGAHTEFGKYPMTYDFYKHGFEGIKPKELNRCEMGQWTDDSSMGLCVADSLLTNEFEFNGIDLRGRFLFWWHCGYNNGLAGERSFGLGGNIYQRFKDFYREVKPQTTVKKY